jgi:predicted dehydrogenase
MNSIGVGIIGTGRIAGLHAKAYMNTPTPCARILMVADVDTERAQKAAEAWETTAASVEEMLMCDEIAAVSVCTPPSSHADIGIACLQANKHVLLEKPIAGTIEDADRLVSQAAESPATLLMVGHTHRYWPANVRAKEVIDSGDIGDIIMASDTIFSEFKYDSEKPPWRLVRDVSGGGIVMDNGIHAIDRLHWWLGTTTKSVFAKTTSDLYDIEVENNCVATLIMENGVYAQMRLSNLVPRAAGYCRAEFVGAKGHLSVDTSGGILLTRTGRPTESVTYDRRIDGLQAEVNEFIQAVAEGTTPRVSAADALAALKVVHAIYGSSANGTLVNLH